MTEYHNQLMDIVRKGKDQFLKYGLIHTIFDKVMNGVPFNLEKDKVKDIFSEEDITFFNEYIPAIFGIKQNYADLNDNQRKELTDIFNDVERIYRQISHE